MQLLAQREVFAKASYRQASEPRPRKDLFGPAGDRVRQTPAHLNYRVEIFISFVHTR
jgi:hypothetical protein